MMGRGRAQPFAARAYLEKRAAIGRREETKQETVDQLRRPRLTTRSGKLKFFMAANSVAQDCGLAKN
jgi:hypothetical protein